MVSSVTDRLKGFSIGAAIKAPAYVATTGANLTLSGAQTIDGIDVGTSQRVLVKDQTDPVENGVYISDSSTWMRASDADGAKDLKPGTLVFVDRGNTHSNSFWIFNSCSTDLSLTPDTDELDLTQVTVALAGVTPFSQGLLVLGSTAAWQEALDLGSTAVMVYDPTLAGISAISTFAIGRLVRTSSTAGLYTDSSWQLGDNSTMTAGGPLVMSDQPLSGPVLEDTGEKISVLGTITASSTLEIDYTAGQVVTVTPSTHLDIYFSNWPSTGAAGALTMEMFNGGSYTITWEGAVLWAGGIAPTLSTALDILTFMNREGSTAISGFVAGQGMS